MVSTSHLEPGG